MLKSALILIIFSARLNVAAQAELDSIILIDSLQIFYESDQFELTTQHNQLLTDFFNYQQTDELSFYIDAFTDDDGHESYNKLLSNRRSDAIALWLKHHNIDENRIFKKGHGEQFARHREAPNIKALDRRSEIKVFQIAPYMIFKGELTLDHVESIESLEISIFDNGIKRKISFNEGTSFAVKVPINREVELQFKVKDYFPTVKKLKLSPRSNVNQVKMPMTKMIEGAIASLHIQFIGDKSIWFTCYESSLSTLASVLLESPNVCIEISGHIHQPGEIITDKEQVKFGLSIARSIEVHNYLVNAGIDQDRLLARGFSNSQMEYPEAMTEEQASANRRVEAKVMSCDSTRLIPNDFVKDLAYYRIKE
jgi:outer membrane protein OmpA-like peptidoglycan-associated protein